MIDSLDLDLDIVQIKNKGSLTKDNFMNRIATKLPDSLYVLAKVLDLTFIDIYIKFKDGTINSDTLEEFFKDYLEMIENQEKRFLKSEPLFLKYIFYFIILIVFVIILSLTL